MGGKMRILIIDDSYSTRDLFMRHMQKSHPDVVVLEAASVEEGVGIFRNDPEITLVLCDLHMAGHTGVECHKAISKECAYRGVLFWAYSTEFTQSARVYFRANGVEMFANNPNFYREVVKRLPHVA